MARDARTLRAAVVALALALSATGCSLPAPASGTSSATPSASLADVELAAELYRSRIDPARGGIQLSVRNDGTASITIVRAVLDSPSLATDIVRDRTTEIGPGLTRDLALTLTTPVCPAATLQAPDAVLTLELADGTLAEVRVPTTDRLGQWSDWVEAECFAVAVLERSSIAVRHDAEHDDGALIGLLVEGVLRDPGLELVALNGTVLFSLVRPDDGARVTSVVLSGAAGEDPEGGAVAVSIPLLLTPARCDAHALADDKQGTLFRLEVLLDGEPGAVTLTADAETRAALYDAFTRACGL